MVRWSGSQAGIPLGPYVIVRLLPMERPSPTTGSEAPSMVMSGRSWKVRSCYRRSRRRRSRVRQFGVRAPADMADGRMRLAGGGREVDRNRLPARQGSAISCHLMPTPQYDESTDNGCDDAGTLKIATTLPTIPRTAVRTKPCGLLGEGEIHLAMKPAMAPTIIGQTIYISRTCPHHLEASLAVLHGAATSPRRRGHCPP